jgi:hypothetical protein
VRREHSSASGKQARPAKGTAPATDALDQYPGFGGELPDAGPQAEAALAQSEEWAGALDADPEAGPEFVQVPGSEGPRTEGPAAASVSAGAAGPAVAPMPNSAAQATARAPAPGPELEAGGEGADADAPEDAAEGEEGPETEAEDAPGPETTEATEGGAGAPAAAGTPEAPTQDAATTAPAGPAAESTEGGATATEGPGGATPGPEGQAPGAAMAGPTPGAAPVPAPAQNMVGGIGQQVVLAVARPEALGALNVVDQLAPLADGSIPVRIGSPADVDAARAAAGNTVGLVDPQGMQAVAARRRADAALSLEQFKTQAETKKQALEALKQKIDPAVAQAQQAAQAKLEQTLAAQKAAIAQAIAQARTTAEQEVTAAKASIRQTHAQTVAQIKADAAGARQGIEQTHGTESGKVTKSQGEIATKVAAAFEKAAQEARDAGAAAGRQAVAVAERRAQQYQARPIPKQGRLSSFFEGEDYEKNKHGARVQAARDVGKAYQAEFAKKAEEAAQAMPQGQSQVVDGLKQRADAAMQAVNAAKTGALRQIDAREKGDLENADRLKQQKLAAVDGALRGARATFARLERSESAKLDRAAAEQRQAIDAQAAERRQGLAQMLDGASARLQQTIDDTIAQAEGIELPDDEKLAASLEEALGKLDEVIGQADQGITQGADELKTALDQSLAQYQQTGDQTVQAAQQSAQQAGQAAAQTAQGEAQGAERALQQIGQGSSEAQGKTKTDACKDMTDASGKLDADLTKATGNLGTSLGKSTQDLNQDFGKSLAGIDGEISKKAEEAANKVQPSWKKWVAVVLTIVISIIVTAAIAALAASGIGLVALIGLSLLIGAAGGVAKMCVEKWASGESITWKDVGKAAAIGAVEGLINLVGAGAGSAVAGKLTSTIAAKFGEEVVKKFAVKAAIFMAETVVGTVIDTIGSGITDTIGRIWDGKEVSLKTFWDAMTGNVVSNFIGNFGGGLLAPYFGKVLSKLGIGKAAAKEAGEAATEEATEKAAKEAAEAVVKQETEAAAKEAAEQAVKAEVEAAAKRAAQQATEEAAEKTTKEAAEAIVKQEAEAAAKQAAENAAKEVKLLPAPKADAPKLLGPGPEAPKLLPAPKDQPKLLGPGPEAPKALPPGPEAPKLLGPGPEAPKALPPGPEAPKLLGPGPEAPKALPPGPKVEEPKLLPAPKDEPKLLGPGPKAEEPKLLGPGPKAEEPKLLPAPKEQADLNAKTDAPRTEAGPQPDAKVQADLHTKVDDAIAPMKGNLKQSPLRAEYEGKVAELKKLADDMLSAGKTPEEVARALHQARRNLGVQYKDLTPGPLRKYIYEVNTGRYGDELGPSFEFLVKKYEADLAKAGITDQKAIFDKIIGASSRPNENVDKLLQNFGDWLKKQPPDYIEKAVAELKAPPKLPASGGGGGGASTTQVDAKVDTAPSPKETPKVDGGGGKSETGPRTEGPETQTTPKTDAAPKTEAQATPKAEPKGAQRTADLEQLYKDAAVAQKELGDATVDIAGKTGGKPIIPDKLKGRPRALEKIETEYKGDASRLTDLARSSVEYKKLEDVYKGLELLKSKYEIVTIKDRFATPTKAGYRDILMTVRMSNGHVCEVQLHLEQVLAVKSGKGHELYEIIRSLEAKAVKEARALTPEELAKIDWANAESRKLYGEAIEKATGGQ